MISGRIAVVRYPAGAFPDFRSPGTILRVFVLAEAINLATIYAHGGGLADLITLGPERLLFDLCLLAVIGALFAIGPWLRTQAYRAARALTIALVMLISGAITWFIKLKIGAPESFEVARAMVLSGLVGIVVMLYLQWRALSLAIAHGNSRLLALQARIRPHFLFNSLNSAISVVRGDPKLAETILLDMADLFRSVLSDDSSVVRIERELEVANSYIEIEQLRLGDRLKVEWQIAADVQDILVPALILQPLVENAVYHGVERLEGGGTISIRIFTRNGILTIEVENPVPADGSPPRPGNRMALENIRERIGLHYDGEAKMEAKLVEGRFRVAIALPVRRA